MTHSDPEDESGAELDDFATADSGPDDIDELDPRFQKEFDGTLADWRRARLLEDRFRESRPGGPHDTPVRAAIDEIPLTTPEPEFGGLPPLVQSRQGRRVARALRTALAVPTDQRRFDFDSHLESEGLFIKEMPAAKGRFTAALWRHQDGPGGAVFLAPGQSPTRARFSIAHELGHYHIPMHRHLNGGPACTAALLSEGIGESAGSRASTHDSPAALMRRVVEAEANDFAAELLMPAYLLAGDIARRDLSIETALELAGSSMYHVSVTAAAWRMVQVTDEACALIVSDEGRVRWQARSRNCPDLTCHKSLRLAPDSAGSAVARGEAHRVRPERVPPHAWLTDEIAYRVPLLESTFRMVGRGQVLSFLWLPELRS